MLNFKGSEDIIYKNAIIASLFVAIKTSDAMSDGSMDKATLRWPQMVNSQKAA